MDLRLDVEFQLLSPAPYHLSELVENIDLVNSKCRAIKEEIAQSWNDHRISFSPILIRRSL
ncbi:uncharacterized protein ARMOST_02002 [Armillaria ostoyae]|uniref:Uncharacterized protein n=1 Tax=Armillaria ostoyae TaxID=47428 RepID=A0A284QQL9_ARMOS|nr:uncharacterized protein ARMOST_02002 [Armillaria ostoyae]